MDTNLVSDSLSAEEELNYLSKELVRCNDAILFIEVYGLKPYSDASEHMIAALRNIRRDFTKRIITLSL